MRSDASASEEPELEDEDAMVKYRLPRASLPGNVNGTREFVVASGHEEMVTTTRKCVTTEHSDSNRNTVCVKDQQTNVTAKRQSCSTRPESSDRCWSKVHTNNENKKTLVGKPGSVADDHLSRRAIADTLEQPTRKS